YRLYKYKVLPFRLINGLAIYQQYINNILFNYLNNFYTAYLDNIIIYSKNKLEYKKYIYKILVAIKKYKFFIRKTNYIKFIIKLGYISIDLKKIETIVS
ncbi:uncharacterized protein K441DRAFT_559832, partial [Cenococcum geophilum 1.58]|uniref:uncharacterized protein n=1 Tax=Cenococcum geophilum 1.58 TaxID=794803 RepID=UPI00358ED7CB